ncbi:F-box protein At4g22390-like [Rosa rugosa]|uniref:F-box protein At4g22390-like n=1 Tax=Rosa rugosa TaxID=74645 RepID=UPI002B4092AA|nr:F-box protein At4g22390-like [Rosa rugosa]
MDLLELPSDILITIFLRLPAESLYAIRCLSKALLKIVDDLFFVTLHKRLLITTNNVAQVPQLMSFARRFAHENYRGLCFLFNPKGEVLRLPRNEVTKYVNFSHVDRDWYGMGFDNMTNTHKIVRVSRVSNGSGKESCLIISQVLVLGTSSWREIPSVPPGNLDYDLSFVKNVCALGDMHWLITGNFIREGSEGTCHIISFDFKKEEFYWTPHPLLQSSNKHLDFFDLHLLTLRGSMALAYTSSSVGRTTDIEIWVLKDYDRKEWTQDYTLNCKMFHKLLWNFGLRDITCGEWKHGMFFKSHSYMFFLDLNCFSINRMAFGNGFYTNILSYTSSLISLKDYCNLVQFETPETGSYANLIEGEEQGFSLSERHTLQGFVYMNR